MRRHARTGGRRRRWIIPVTVLLLVLPELLASTEATVMDVVTPPPFSAVASDHISVVGKTTCSTVVLSLPNRKPETTSTVQGWFHFRATLNYGFNELYVVSSGGDSIWLAAVRLPFQASIQRSKVHYPKFFFHGNKLGEPCTPCHSLTPFTRSDAALPDSTCQSCHRPKREWIKPHRPAADAECRICHGSGVLPIAAPADNIGLCQACHKGKIKEFNKDFVHGPVGAGSCIACHEPHGSAADFSLREPVKLLCLSCHVTTDANAKGKNVHPPFQDGACTSCHDPHATNYAWGLSRHSNSICLPCHHMDDGNDWHSHPVTGKPHSRKNPPVKVNAKGELECTSCHNPHYSEAPHLLRSGEAHTCQGCHDDK